MSVPHGHWKTTTCIAGLRSSGIVAPYVVDCPVNRDIFEARVEQALLRELRPGDIVIMDNLSSHKGPRVRALIESRDASLLYLPPYSPDFNPSKTPSPSSRPYFAERPPAPSTRFGLRSVGSSTSSRHRSARTCSPPLATIQTDRTLL